MDPHKQIVARGYDRIGQAYLELTGSMGMQVRQKYLDEVLTRLHPGATVLELGCGAGLPMTQTLARRFRMTGVDLSAGQLRRARQNVPASRFVRADMGALCFSVEAFEGVLAFYSLTHLPRGEHAALLGDAYRLLRPGGLLVITMGSGDDPGSVEADWLGAPMYFSHFDGETNVRLVELAGFRVISAEDERELEYGQPVCFRWVVAEKEAEEAQPCGGESLAFPACVPLPDATNILSAPTQTVLTK